MSKQNKKERHKAKRDAKRAAERRKNSLSPVKRLVDAPGDVECWTSGDFGSLGQMQFLCFKRAGGLSGVAAFLIDRGVVGLKDAWIQLNIDRLEFEDKLRLAGESGPMRRTSAEEARRWVAGGMRWAHDNGMRLPRDWAKPASLIGGVGDWASADVSAFVKEFAGHPEDLRQRLIAERFETYIQREDIAFEFNEAAPFMDQRTGEYQNNEPWEGALMDEELERFADELPAEELDLLADKFTAAAMALASKTADWIPATESPSPELFEAWRSILMASMISRASMPDAGENEVADFGFELLQDMSDRIEPSSAQEHHRAVGQALRFLQTDPNMMQKAVLEHGFGEGC